MREILFRGRLVDGGGWVVGCLLRGTYIIPTEVEFEVDIGWKGTSSTLEHVAAYDVDPDTVGQFAGMTDKNGKLIYEGDLMKCSYNEIYDFAIYVVGFNDGAFAHVKCLSLHHKENGYEDISRVGYSYNSHLTQNDTGKCEVIGNVHDNPELLGANQ